MILTRRRFLEAGRDGSLALLGGLLLTEVACSDSGPECVDPELLSTPERALRDANAYVSVSASRSPNGEEKQCGGCAFFSSEGEPTCGRCEILGGPVSAAGHCDAWSKAEPPSASASRVLVPEIRRRGVV